MRIQTVSLRAAALGAALLFYGCATAPEALIPPVGANYEPGNEVMDDNAAVRELALSTRMIKSGDYSMAIPRLLHVMEKYPSSSPAIEARYHLGLTYYNLGGLRDAQQYFNEYLSLAPEGPFAASSRSYVAGLSEEATEKFPTVQEVQTEVAQAQQALAAKPGDLAAQLELADLYWKSGQYEPAGGIYRQVLAAYPNLIDDARISTRMEPGAGGQFNVITPQMGSERQAENEPLSIFNTNAFRSGRFQSYQATSREIYYTVTGQALNRGSEPLRNVEVIVTIYGFGNQIFDTRTISIGRLRPGENRPFSAKFSNFDDIENVDRYECVGTFER